MFLTSCLHRCTGIILETYEGIFFSRQPSMLINCTESPLNASRRQTSLCWQRVNGGNSHNWMPGLRLMCQRTMWKCCCCPLSLCMYVCTAQGLFLLRKGHAFHWPLSISPTYSSTYYSIPSHPSGCDRTKGCWGLLSTCWHSQAFSSINGNC